MKRAEETNPSREVAIKVLPEPFTQDPQRLVRFERKARLLASLTVFRILNFEFSRWGALTRPALPGQKYFQTFTIIFLCIHILHGVGILNRHP